MTESNRPARRSDSSAGVDPRDSDEAERLLGRALALGLPSVCIVAAIVVGFVASVGSAILVLASGALLGTIALLWASLRTLSGDAPLPAGLLAASAELEGVDALEENKRRALRALKDLETERAVGRIDDADYEVFQARYREEAKTLMRRMDERAAPSRAEAERIANAYVAEKGITRPAEPAPSRPPASRRAEAPSARAERVVCARCAASNEPDAAFCKQCGSGIEKATDAGNATA